MGVGYGDCGKRVDRLTLVGLRGRLVEEFYDEFEMTCTDAIELSPNGPVVALNIPKDNGILYVLWRVVL